MMAFSDVKVLIDLTKPRSERETFYFPLLVAGSQTDTQNTYTEYTSVDEVAKKYPYPSMITKTASVIFSQNKTNPVTKLALLTIPAPSPLTGDDIVNALQGVLANGWRQLLITPDIIDTIDVITKVADFIETTNRLFFAQTAWDAPTYSILSTLKAKNYKRTVCLLSVFASQAEGVVSQLIGATAGLVPGSFTYKNIVVQGIRAMNDIGMQINDSDLEQLHELGGMTYLKKAGDVVTSEGKVISGEYIDIIDSQDFIIDDIQFALQKVLNQNDKVSYDDPGIALLETTVISRLQNAANLGMIAHDSDGIPIYEVKFLTRDEVNPSDRAARLYKGGSFSFALAGAIHTVEVHGEIII